MADPPNKKKLVVFAKGVPPQAMTLCLTVRDVFGFAVPDLKLDVVDASGAKLRAVGGGALVTDKDGRVDVANVEPGNLTVHVDDKHVPDDTADTRNGVAQRYVYTVASAGEPSIVMRKDTDDASRKFFIDSTRAYLTVFLDVNPFTPKFRFPWQNPVHRDELKANDAIYRYRVRALHELLEMVFRQADAKTLDHAACVARLVDLFKKNAVPGGGAARVTPPDPPPSQPVVEGGATPPRPPPEPTPAPGPTPSDVEHGPVQVNVAPPPPPPPPAVPPVPQGPPADPDALPKWVWYLMFHVTGLRYTPLKRQNGAHFSYFAPTKLLQQLRFDEIDARWPGRGAKTGFPKTPDPEPRDVSEAFVLAESRKDRDSYKPGLCDSDPAKVKATLVTFFRKLAGEAETAQAKRADAARLLNGDHFALGLLKAKHLKNKFPDADLKTLVSHTALRNDVTAPGWEVAGESMQGFAPSVATVLERGGWKGRHKETSDVVMNSAVCNQTAEIAENIRGNAMTVGGIPSNAQQAADHGALMHFTLANAPRIRRGMHVVFTIWGSPKVQDQASPNDLMAVEHGWWLPIDTKGTTEADIVPVASIPELVATFGDLVDTNDPVNRLLVQRAKPNDSSSVAVGNVVRKEKEFTGFRRVPQVPFFPGTRDGGPRGNCFIRCRAETVQDAEPDPKKPNAVVGKTHVDSDGKTKPSMVEVDRLELLKWNHQEFVIDVRKGGGGFEIFTLSTGANVVQSVPPLPAFESGTGIKKYVLNASTPRKAGLLVGFAFDGERPDDDLLSRCYLNTDLLLKA